MTKSMFITAAPVGAIPKNVNVQQPKFVPANILDRLISAQERHHVTHLIEADGWEQAGAGGIGISESIVLSEIDLRRLYRDANGLVLRQFLEQGWRQTACGTLRLNDAAMEDRLMPEIPHATLNRLGCRKLARKVVLCLTTQGWSARGDGALVWPHGLVESYLPPDLVAAIKVDSAEALQSLLDSGWAIRTAGYWHAGRSCSPRLPITPDSIIAESLDAMHEGASIVHLHTRNHSDRTAVYLPGFKNLIVVSTQANYIDEAQYEQIIPGLQRSSSLAILNLSTSVRGSNKDFESPARRSHLKRYAPHRRAPEMASFSPGAVIFQTGGGYGNSPDFLASQLAHFKSHNIRPEIEVFNGEILRNAIGPYRADLILAGEPVLFMLVVGVDQYRKSVDENFEDDSLIPSFERKKICRALLAETLSALDEAVQITVSRLRPKVQLIRCVFPRTKISILMPGPMQRMLTRVAAELQLDGVRVGLEDALNVPDESVPGGIRKGSTAEQVRFVRKQLEAMGIRISTAAETRDDLGMLLSVAKSISSLRN